MGGLFLGSPAGLSLFLVLPEAAQWHFVLSFETCTAIHSIPLISSPFSLVKIFQQQLLLELFLH